jgi:hypothetical protein
MIDVHVHVCRIPGPPRGDRQAFSTAEQLIERYDEIGIERGVLLPLVSPEVYLPQSNEDILEICEEYPDRFIPFCNVDPRAVSNTVDAPLERVLEFYRDRGCRGLGEVTANMPFLHPKVQNLCRALQEVGMPMTIHIAPELGVNYGLHDDPGLPGLGRTLARFPELKIIGHSQPFWAEIGRLDTPSDRYGYPDYPVREEGVVPKLMRRYPNLYGDLSAGSGHNALARDPEHAVQFIEEFQDRLMFGTDITSPTTPVPQPEFLRGLRDEGKISEEIWEKILRTNAEKLLNLD